MELVAPTSFKFGSNRFFDNSVWPGFIFENRFVFKADSTRCQNRFDIYKNLCLIFKFMHWCTISFINKKCLLAKVCFWCNDFCTSPSIFIHFFAQFGICCAIFMHFFIVSEMHNVNFNSSILYAICYCYMHMQYAIAIAIKL